MKQLDEGIHKRLNQLLFKIGAFNELGGYDYKFHAKKIAEKYGLNHEDLIEIMELSDSSNHSMANALFNRYLNGLKDGTMTMEEIRQQEKERVEKSIKHLFNVWTALGLRRR